MIYNLDMTYNVFKRVRKDLSNRVVSEKELFNAILEFYSRIGAHLRNEKENYGEAEVQFNYFEIFKECPYIKAITAIGEKQNSKVPERIVSAFRAISAPLDPDDIETDRSVSR